MLFLLLILLEVAKPIIPNEVAFSYVAEKSLKQEQKHFLNIYKTEELESIYPVRLNVDLFTKEYVQFPTDKFSGFCKPFIGKFDKKTSSWLGIQDNSKDASRWKITKEDGIYATIVSGEYVFKTIHIGDNIHALIQHKKDRAINYPDSWTAKVKENKLEVVGNINEPENQITKLDKSQLVNPKILTVRLLRSQVENKPHSLAIVKYKTDIVKYEKVIIVYPDGNDLTVDVEK